MIFLHGFHPVGISFLGRVPAYLPHGSDRTLLFGHWRPPDRASPDAVPDQTGQLPLGGAARPAPSSLCAHGSTAVLAASSLAFLYLWYSSVTMPRDTLIMLFLSKWACRLQIADSAGDFRHRWVFITGQPRSASRSVGLRLQNPVSTPLAPFQLLRLVTVTPAPSPHDLSLSQIASSAE